MAHVVWRVSLYVSPRRPCTTMVFHLTVACKTLDRCAGPALTVAAKRVIDTSLSWLYF